MSSRGNTLDLGRVHVMAIMNITPDSFYAGSRRAGHSDGELEDFVRRAVGDGATIIDVGGYSSRPGAADISAEEEWERVERGLAAVRRAGGGVAVSVDTFRAEVARRAIENFGSCIINDISGGDLDPAIVDVAAMHGVPYIAMHMRGTPADMQLHTDYDDIVGQVAGALADRCRRLRERGVREIILDPGFGFAKTTRQNYELLAGMDRLLGLGCPILAGVSRKSMIYSVLGVSPGESFYGTVALNWEALNRGATILRVHDVRAASDVVKLHNYYKGHE